MARFRSGKTTDPAKPRKSGRLRQMGTIFRMTARTDRAMPWWVAFGVVVTLLVGVLIGVLVQHVVYVLVLTIPIAFLIGMVIFGRRAERAAFAQIADQPGATGAALRNLRRGWSVTEEPVAVDPRSQDLIFRAVGRPGVVLVTEGPLPRVNRLVEQERRRLAKVLPNVPVHVVHAGDDEGQIPLRKLATKISRMRPALTKIQVIEVTKRLKALGAARLPIPKGIDPLRARPDRRMTRGR